MSFNVSGKIGHSKETKQQMERRPGEEMFPTLEEVFK